MYKWTILLNSTSLIFTTVLYHFILCLDKALALVLWQRQCSVHDQDDHNTSVTPERPIEAEVVKEERVELDGSEHIDSSAGTTNT